MTPVVVAISSHVSASVVGLRAATPALQSLGVEVWPVPTVLFGLHPGWERRPGLALEGDPLKGLLEAALVHPHAPRISWVMTGHFSNVGQIEAVIDILPAIRRTAPGAKLLVDPIMGDDERGLYVSAEVAEAISDLLVPAADLVTPNAWEAQKLTDRPAGSPAEAVAAARAFDCPALITSVRRGDRIGAIYVDDAHALYAHAPEQKNVPNGTGDLLAAAFLGATATGAAPAEALLDAVRRVGGAISAAETQGLKELCATAIAQGSSAPAAIEALVP